MFLKNEIFSDFSGRFMNFFLDPEHIIIYNNK